MPDIFLSYSREDQPTARRYAEGLQRAGFDVWWDQTLAAGEHYDKVTEQALRGAKAVVVLWSKSSVESRWVRAEATIADRNRTLVPVMIEPCDRPVMFELTQTAELAHWQGNPQDPAWLAFVGAVRRKTGGDALSPVAHAAAPKAGSPPGRNARIAVIALAALLASGIGMWAWQRFGNSKGETNSGSPSATAPLTILVLPFDNQSPDPDQDYFANGVTEELLNQLGQVKALRPLGMSTGRSLKTRGLDSRQLRAEFGIDYVVTGSVLKGKNGVRIIPSLTDTRDGSGLSLPTYDHVLDSGADQLDLYRELARSIAKALRIKLDAGDLPRSQGGTTDVEAQDLYLRAQDLYRNSEAEPAVELLRQAQEKDPTFYAAAFWRYVILSPAAAQNPDKAPLYLRQKEDVAKQLEKAPLAGGLALTFRGERLRQQRNWLEVMDVCNQNTAVAVGLSSLSCPIGFYLMNVGRFNDALPYHQESVERDPLARDQLQWLMTAHLVLGDIDKAKAVLLKYLKARGEPAELADGILASVSLMSTGSSTNPADLQALKKEQLLGKDGRIKEPSVFAGLPPDFLDDRNAVLELLRTRLVDPGSQSEGPLSRIAFTASFFGDPELALAALRRNYVDIKSGFVLSIFTVPTLRRHPAFRKLVADLRLVDYWRDSGKWGDFCREDKSSVDGFTCH